MTSLARTLPQFFLFVVLSSATSGCMSLYYEFWESLGRSKRELLRSEVQEAREDQKGARKQLESALENLERLYGLEGGKLEEVYEGLKADYEVANQRAELLRDRIDKVETIASDLFEEWEDEAESITNEAYREDSLEKLATARARFETMKTSMHAAEESMEPVLTQLRDQVLYLKHNLNAEALGSIKTEVEDIKREIRSLVDEIRRSLEASDEFVQTLPSD